MAGKLDRNRKMADGRVTGTTKAKEELARPQQRRQQLPQKSLKMAKKVVQFTVSKGLPPTPPESFRAMPQRATPTVPRPFRLSTRPPVPCRFAQRHLEAMLAERERRDAEQRPFCAKPVPESTYNSPADIGIHIGRLKSARSVPSLPTAVPEQTPLRPRPVPLSTYIRPSPSLDELRMLRRERRAVEELVEARGPRGMEEHSIRWRVQWRLRHSLRCLAPVSFPRPRAMSVPDFALLHAQFQRRLAANRPFRPSTLPRPFRLTKTKKERE